jgi:hypothetical protein
MSLAAQVIARLQGLTVDGDAILAGRTAGAAALAVLQQTKAYPQVTPAAHVVPTGLRGLPPDSYGGSFTLPVVRGVAVILTVRTHDATGARWLDRIDDIVEAIVTRIAGWTPDSGSRGVLTLDQAVIAGSDAGTLVYQIAFTLDDQMRISP